MPNWRVRYADGDTQALKIDNDAMEALFQGRIKVGHAVRVIGRIPGGSGVAQFLSTIRPAPSGAGGGPFICITETGGSISKCVTGISTLSNALDQAKTDQAAILSGTVSVIRIDTTST